MSLIKEKGRNVESFKQPCFELFFSSFFCPFPVLVGRAPRPAMSCRAQPCTVPCNDSQHLGNWWGWKQVRAALYLGSSGRKRRNRGLFLLLRNLSPLGSGAGHRPASLGLSPSAPWVWGGDRARERTCCRAAVMLKLCISRMEVTAWVTLNSFIGLGKKSEKRGGLGC